MTFLGHALPGTFFAVFGAFFLGLTFKRAKVLKPGESIAQHIPESNARILRNIGIALICATAMGSFYEIMALLQGHTKSKIAMHVTMYLSFMFVGLVGLMESAKVLPADSYRYAYFLSSLLESILWYDHAMMKSGAEKSTHMFEGHISFVSSFVFLYGALNPKHVPAFITGWALLIVQGLWLWILAFLDGNVPPVWTVAPSFCLINLFVFVVVAAVTASVYKGEETNTKVGYAKTIDGPFEEEYGKLTSMEQNGTAFANP